MGILEGPAFPRLCILATAVPLLAQGWTTFHSAYQDGLAAQARGDHALAVKAFARAAFLQPTPGVRVHTYGLNFLPTYHPYLHLAESALALGDLAAAEAALQNPASLAGEPAGPRAALLEKIRSLRQAAPSPASPARNPGPAPSSGPAAKAAAPPPAVLPPPPAAVVVPASNPAAPGLLPGAAPSRAEKPLPPSGRPRTATEPPNAPREDPVRSPGPAASPVPAPGPAVQAASAPVPRSPSRPWPLLAGASALAALGGWLLARRKPRPAPTPWTDLATAVPTAVPASLEGDTNLGRSFGPWLAKSVLGRGGCATAYRGVHMDSGQEVAIKVPHPHLAQDREFLARFRREAALGAVLDHPRIVGILDPGPPEGHPWLVMPYVKGITLEAHIRRTGALPIPQVVHIAADVAEAMAYAHAKGIVHRDLKPANVMLTERGAVVMDLGIARLLEGGKVTSMYLGTPTYSAPESMANPSVGPPADRYALGVMLFEMLAGQPPFQGETPFQILEAHRFQPLPDLDPLRPLVPRRLHRLIQRLCAKAPEDRPEDGEMLQILGELRKELPLGRA